MRVATTPKAVLNKARRPGNRFSLRTIYPHMGLKSKYTTWIRSRDIDLNYDVEAHQDEALHDHWITAKDLAIVLWASKTARPDFVRNLLNLLDEEQEL